MRNIAFKFTVFWLMAIGLLLSSSHPARAQGETSAQVYRQGYNLILDESWQQAITIFDRLSSSAPSSEWSDDAAFWSCYARQQLKKPEAELFDCYESLLEDYEDSEWADDARSALVRLAKSLDRQGRPEYRERVSDFGPDTGDDRLLAILVALGEIGDERSVEVILEHLDKTQDELTRARIVETLSEAESELAVTKLRAILSGDPSERVRLAALEALADNDLFDSEQLLRDIIQDQSQPIRLRREALDELGDHEPEGFLDLLKELALGNNSALAIEAIDEISDVETEQAVVVLVEVLTKSSDYRRRLEVIDSLEDLPFDSSVAALLEVARDDPDPRMRREATESLGDMESEESRDALIQLLREAGN